MDERDAQLILRAQRGLPLEREPFAALGRGLGMDEDAVLARLRAAFARGEARRLGAVFEPEALGYRTALAALRLPEARVDGAAAALAADPGVTHCYLRGWPAELPPDAEGAPRGRTVPNLWFTFGAPAGVFESALDALGRRAAGAAPLILPAVRRFRVEAIFDPAARSAAPAAPASGRPARSGGPPPPLAESDRRLVIALQGHLALDRRPFDRAAAEAGLEPEAALAHMRRWMADGILRRIALVVRHRRLGVLANAMCAWDVPPGGADAAGPRLAAQEGVSHCYLRARREAFPFDLYAMIHAPDWPAAHARFAAAARAAGLRDGLFLGSTREYKKTSMAFFAT